MTRWRWVSSIIALPAMLAPQISSPAEPSALAQAWRGVVAQSPEYAAARARREAGPAASAAARAMWMPTIGAEGGIGRRNVQSTTSGAQFSAPGFGTSNEVDFRTSVNDGNAHQWGVVLQQPLLDAGRVADSAALRSRARMAEAQFHLTEQTLMVRTAEALAAVVEADARFKAARRQHEAARRERDQAQVRFESGDMPVTEWREAQAQLDALAVDELDAQQALAVATASYSDLTGLAAPSAGLDILAPTPTVLPESVVGEDGATLEQWLRRANDSSPALALQAEMLAQAQAESRRWSRLDGFHLDLIGRYGRESVSGRGDYGAAEINNRGGSIGLQATVPVFSGGMRAAQRRSAESAERAAQADLEAARQQVSLRTRTAWLGVESARARVHAQSRALESAMLRLDATRVGFDAGDRTLLDVMTAEGRAWQAAADRVRARCQGLVATLRLAAAAGSLTPLVLDAADTGTFACEARE